MSSVSPESNYPHPPTLSVSSPARSRSLKGWFSRFVPRRVKAWARRVLNTEALLVNVAYDARRFRRWSSAIRRRNARSNLRALIAMNTHNIEKGLSLKAPRPGFGVDRIRTLMGDVHEYANLYGFDGACEVSARVLRQYREFNLAHGIDNREVAAFLDAMGDQAPAQTDGGGTFPVTRVDLHRAAKMDLKPFFASRFSIRQFDPNHSVDIQVIEEAVSMAQKTPSVCNRQSCRVWVLQEREKVQGALDIQKGATGFAEQVGTVLIVTSELAHFVNVGERYQAWIDGGMFSMSLVYALHSLGLGTCCLNWSKRREVDKKLKRFVGIGDSETVIMLIAVGHLPETLNVAQSVRKPLDEVLCVPAD